VRVYWRSLRCPVKFLANRTGQTANGKRPNGDSMPLPFLLVMFVLPAAIIATAVILARFTRQRER